MARPLPVEDSARVLVAGLALWAAGAVLGAACGVFATLWPDLLAGVAAFAALYALAAYGLDEGLRRCVDEAGARALWTGVAALDGALAVTAWEAWQGRIDAASLAAFPWALVPLFVAPLALVATVAAVRAARPVRRAPARSPGARPAAT